MNAPPVRHAGLRAVRGVLIDLDGTLLDTAPDLTRSANAMLAEMGYARLPEGRVRDFIGDGIAPLVARCLQAAGATLQPVAVERAVERFSVHYERESGRAAGIYPGVREGLLTLRGNALRTACVTNKAARFALPLLRATGLAPLLDAVVTSDQAGVRKPDPGIFLQACVQLGVEPAQAAVIGDSPNDAEGARAAGCRALLVSYGYSGGRDVRTLDCDAVVASLLHAAEILGERASREIG